MVKSKKVPITTPSAENAAANAEAATNGTNAPTPAAPVKENSEENVVYIYPSKQTEQIPSLSPECMAIETSLRFRKINYKYATNKCVEKPHGEPVILLNEREYTGLDKIEEGIAAIPAAAEAESVVFPELTADQQADCQAYVYALIDTVLYQVLYVQRFKHTTSTTAELNIIKRVKSGFQRFFNVSKDEDRITKMKPEELTEIVKDGLSAINNYLKRGDGNKIYFFGDKPTKHDAVIFGLLSQYWLEPPTANGGSTADFKLSSLLESVSPEDNKIMPYLQNIKDTYWPDWKERCAKPPPPPPVASPNKRGTFRKSKSEQQPALAIVGDKTSPLATAAGEATAGDAAAAVENVGGEKTPATNGSAKERAAAIDDDDDLKKPVAAVVQSPQEIEAK